MGFSKLELSEAIQKTLKEEGYTVPTPIQAEAIPHVLSGRDVLGIAQTGTGKTAAFALPIIQRLMDPSTRVKAHEGQDSAKAQAEDGHPANETVSKSARKTRALILSPTRELAGQIEESFKTYGRGTPLRVLVIYGGVGQEPQVKALRHGVDVIVATPGRLLDLMNQGYVDLRHIKTFVLDEADQMMDMGFIYDIRKIVAMLPKQRQSLMFSATMPPEIRKLADTILVDPVTVAVSKTSSAAETVDHSILFVESGQKPSALVAYLNSRATGRVLVFTRTKHGADKVVRYLESYRIFAAGLHANKSQGQRKRTMAAFKSQKPPVLVATDIAARGLDIDEITHVVNYNIPNVSETYVHRIGRTGRAGASGTAISFCDGEEKAYLRGIEKLLGSKIPVLNPDFSKADPAVLKPAAFVGTAETQAKGEMEKSRPAPRPQAAPKNYPPSRPPVVGGFRTTQPNVPNARTHGGPSGARPGQPVPAGPVGQHRPAERRPGGGAAGGVPNLRAFEGNRTAPASGAGAGHRAPAGSRSNVAPHAVSHATRSGPATHTGGTAGGHGPRAEQRPAAGGGGAAHQHRPARRSNEFGKPTGAAPSFAKPAFGKPAFGKPGYIKPGAPKPGGTAGHAAGGHSTGGAGGRPHSARPQGRPGARGLNQWGYPKNSAGGKAKGKKR